MSKILVVFEGKTAEPRLFDFIREKYFNDETLIVYSIFGTVIYKLWKDLASDEYLSSFQLIKESSEENEIALSDFNRDDFSEIYLFFDHDGHASNACNIKLTEMLNIFNDEYEQGRLYINYPMIESIMDVSVCQEYQNKVFKVDQNRTYKKIARERCKFTNINAFTSENWSEIMALNCKKANLIVSGEYEIPEHVIQQSEIFNKQVEEFIVPHNEVSILNSFPLFIAEYFGIDKVLD